jgi:DNA-3-methyladenine glycosylase II
LSGSPDATADSAAVAALRAADPVLGGVIDAAGGLAGIAERRRGRVPGDHLGTLMRSIVGQQVSVAAASAIWGRLTDRYDGRVPTPIEILADDPEELRAAAGLSRSKVTYLRSLASHVLEGTLRLEALDELPDEEVLHELVAVKGIGEWSAHMFLIFHLQRPDVLAVGDLGVRKAVMLAYGMEQMPPPAEVARIGEAWQPYRTLAGLFLWQSLSVTPI